VDAGRVKQQRIFNARKAGLSNGVWLPTRSASCAKLLLGRLAAANCTRRSLRPLSAGNVASPVAAHGVRRARRRRSAFPLRRDLAPRGGRLFLFWRVEGPLDLDDIVLVKAIDLDDGARWIRPLAP
jgi:hypothetical protein